MSVTRNTPLSTYRLKKKMGERWESLLSQTQNRPCFHRCKVTPPTHLMPGVSGGRGPSRTRISDFCQAKMMRDSRNTKSHSPNARGAPGAGSFAHSDSRFLPDKNDAGVAHSKGRPSGQAKLDRLRCRQFHVTGAAEANRHHCPARSGE
jgi:hypothetical protein